MMPTETAIANAMAEKRMDRMQAINHLRASRAVKHMMAARRRGARFYHVPRSYTVAPYRSYLPMAMGYPASELFALRCCGTGQSCIAYGAPTLYPDRESAERAGEVWNDTGVQPADQRD